MSSRTIRLSSLSLSNDTMEGKLVTTVLSKLAERDGLDQKTVRRLHQSLEFLERTIDGLGFCLSEEPDLLSQWRGYADDASGVSIGFSSEYLDWLGRKVKNDDAPGFKLERVEYEADAQEDHVRPTYEKVREFIDDGAYKFPGVRGLLDTRTDEEVKCEEKQIREAFYRLSMTILLLFPKLFLLKSHAFREEREWRLISFLVRGGKDACSFRSVRDRLIPYREIDLLEIDRNPLEEIVLGPKHDTPTMVIEDFLKQNGFVSISVRRSAATYR